jgi:hypothetical protein
MSISCFVNGTDIGAQIGISEKKDQRDSKKMVTMNSTYQVDGGTIYYSDVTVSPDNVDINSNLGDLIVNQVPSKANKFTADIITTQYTILYRIFQMEPIYPRSRPGSA